MTRIVAAAFLILLVAAAPASALPNLSVSMPQDPTPGQIAPVYVDAFEQPGHLVYRFDTLIHNDGTTLDLYRDEDTGHAMQALWTGDPSPDPDPATKPTGVPLSDRTQAVGAKIEFVTEKSHAHFHFFTAARYELLVPGGPSRVSGKIGFCLSDAFGGAGGTVVWFQPHELWCNPPSGHPEFTRMGLSTGAADRYRSQLEFQFVDMTGLAPGTYTLRGTANPEGSVLESDGVPDVTEVQRELPGVIADPAQAASSGAPASITLSGRATALDIPARRSADCAPNEIDRTCYVWASASDPLGYAATAPAYGTAAVSGSRVTYTPAAGFSGEDRFTYTATDARGLVSRPATVAVRVTAPAGPAAPPGQPAPPQPSASQAVFSIVSARRSGPRQVAVRIRCKPVAAAACTGRVRLRAGGRAIGSRRLSALLPARARTLQVHLTRATRRVIRVRVIAGDASGRTVLRTRSIRPRR